MRNNLPDSLGGTSAGWNNVVVDGTSTAPVLGGGAVDSLLGCRCGVDGAHETLNDAEVVIDDLGERCKTIGSARGIGDDLVLGFVGIKVDTANEHGGIRRGCGDDDFLCTTLEVGGCSKIMSAFENYRSLIFTCL